MRTSKALLVLLCTAMTTLPVPLHAWPRHQTLLEVPQAPVERAPLPVPNSTKSFWFTDPDVRPAPDHGSEGPLTSDADICIIGSGITGVSAAYHLAKAFKDNQDLVSGPRTSVKAVILEARHFCSGATGRNGGHLTAHLGDTRRQIADRGIDETRRTLAIEHHTVDGLTKALSDSGKEDYADLTHGGRLVLFFTDEELAAAKADHEAALSAGFNVGNATWLSKEEVWKTYGAPYPGLLIPGHNLWPLKAVSVLFNRASNLSDRFTVDLHTHTPVTSVEPLTHDSSLPAREFPRRHVLTTPRGKISCSFVLHATNAYASHLLPHLTGPAGIIPTRGQVMAVRAAVSAEELTPVAGIGNEGLEYWFPRPVKTPAEEPLVIVGGGREAAHGLEVYETDDSVVNEDVGQALRKFLPTVFPEKYEKDREPALEWTGVMGYTKSGDPFVGPVSAKSNGQYISAGYNGHGMPRAFSCAEAVGGMIAADIRGTDWEVPDWLPRSYLTTAKHRGSA